jgi:hypothetical protein
MRAPVVDGATPAEGWHSGHILSDVNAPTAPRSLMRVRRVSFARVARSAAAVAPAVALMVALTWPLYLTSSSFAGSWGLDLWFVSKQSLTIQGGHLPSFFLNYPHGVFYPLYAFYGGTLFALTAAASLVLGDAQIATYVLTYLLAVAAAYGGWYWISRQAGLGRWDGQVPGIVFVTASYYLTMIYADGDWPELVAISTIPLMIAAGVSILRADRLRMGPALAFTISAVVFFGSHALTLVWGATTIVVVALAIVACVPQARREISRRGPGRLAGLAVPAMLVSAWFLVPAAIYESSTWIASEYASWASVLRSSMSLVSTDHLFTLSRATASPGDVAFALSLPILAMAWAFVGLALALLSGRRGPWMRILLICAGFTTAMIVFVTHAGLILALPRYYSTLQFSYRLENYALLGLSGSVLSILVLAKTETRSRLRSWSRWALPSILAVAVVGSIQQVAAYPSTKNRDAEVASRSTEAEASESTSLETTPAQAMSSGGVLKDYVDVKQPILESPGVAPQILTGSDVHPPLRHVALQSLPLIEFDTTTPQAESVVTATNFRQGELVNSNLFGSPGLVHVTGAKIVAINGEDGADVLAVGPASNGTGASAGTRTISVSTSSGVPVVLGRALSICAVIALVLQFALMALRRRRHAR